jgi:hypothetical protein
MSADIEYSAQSPSVNDSFPHIRMGFMFCCFKLTARAIAPQAYIPQVCVAANEWNAVLLRWFRVYRELCESKIKKDRIFFDLIRTRIWQEGDLHNVIAFVVSTRSVSGRQFFVLNGGVAQLNCAHSAAHGVL